MAQGITCILTTWKRPQNLTKQIEALAAQTVKPARILIWNNSEANVTYAGVHVVSARPNMGVWPRFLIGMEAPTDLVCIFDDDTVPGSRWLENCLTTMDTHNGLLGTVGVKFKSIARSPYERHGWPNPNDKVVEVDLVGHSWFFKKDWLRYYALEPRQSGATCGEDYHFSVALHKHLKLGTYVPPHPASNKELWGSVNGMELGTDAAALYRAPGENNKKVKMHEAYVASGWRPLCVRKG